MTQTAPTPGTSHWRYWKWPSITLFTIAIIGGLITAVVTDGKPPSIQTGYNAAISVLRSRGSVPVEQLKTGLAITVNERHIQHYNLAVILREADRTDEAISHLRSAVKLRPNYALARRDLALLLLSSDPKEALLHVQAAVEADTKDGAAWFLLGNALGMNGRWKHAIGAYNRSLRHGFVRASVHHNFATALRNVGATEEARTHYQRALAIDPGYERSRKALAGLGSEQ